MPKITPRKGTDTVVVKTQTQVKKATQAYQWWKAKSKAELASQILDTAAFLKEQQAYRYRQASIYARLYGNMPLFTAAGPTAGRLSALGPIGPNNLPLDRPTMNVIQSCVDTKVSRISQARPRPIFLTDAGNYKERNLAKKLNQFIVGEFYQIKAYEMGELILRDACVTGTGAVKVFRTADGKVGMERRLNVELLVDPNDAMYGSPRQLFEYQLVDRSVLAELFPSYRSQIAKAEQGFPDAGEDSQKTASDQIIIVEAWHLPSGPNAKDGRHAIVCSEGTIEDDEDWNKPKFPHVLLHDSPRILGLWGQGTPERLMGTQVEINKLLMTISASINLVGVPRVFVEQNSKVGKPSLNNQIGAIVPYTGVKPSYEIAPCIAPEIYAQLQRLIEYAYQQEGVSQLAASSVKPAGLNSGEAQRAYQDNQTDRLAALSKRYDNFFVDLAYACMDVACEIAEETGSYQTIYPGKDGTRKIDLPAIKELTRDPFVIQCFDASSLPRDPAGRLQKVTEMMQAGLIDPQEGRRLLDYPDIEQVDKLANASEERILEILDRIIEDGTLTRADPFMDLNLALKLVIQYYNLYAVTDLEAEKLEMLRNFFTQVQVLLTPPAPSPLPMGGVPGGMPQASPEALPTNPMIPNVPGAA